ncbi:transposase [Sphingomonas xinjiangensis]|uniref:transposase n=1 Tax=Sphingomonas xinjiangensis TaxID=643568 RepID=UPI0016114223
MSLLLPELRRGDVVIMENLSSHNAPVVREMIEAVGASRLLFPPCSPDLNPIKQTFSKLGGAPAQSRQAHHPRPL